jgi:hypothetical protein
MHTDRGRTGPGRVHHGRQPGWVHPPGAAAVPPSLRPLASAAPRWSDEDRVSLDDGRQPGVGSTMAVNPGRVHPASTAQRGPPAPRCGRLSSRVPQAPNLRSLPPRSCKQTDTLQKEACGTSSPGGERLPWCQLTIRFDRHMSYNCGGMQSK